MIKSTGLGQTRIFIEGKKRCGVAGTGRALRYPGGQSVAVRCRQGFPWWESRQGTASRGARAKSGLWVPSPARHPVQPAQRLAEHPAEHRDVRKTTIRELKSHTSPATDTDCHQLFIFSLWLKYKSKKAQSFLLCCKLITVRGVGFVPLEVTNTQLWIIIIFYIYILWILGHSDKIEGSCCV